MAKNIAIMIDGANFYETAKRLNFVIDYKRLLLTFERYDIHCASFFTGLNPQHDGIHSMVQWMENNGYRAYTKIFTSHTNDSGIVKRKANMDVEIAVECMLVASRVDEVHLFTGDGDFTYLVKAMQHDGAKVVVYSSRVANMCSEMLRRQADNFVELDHIKHDLSRIAAAATVVPRIIGRKKFFGS
jgi:uncharacterized LabA/DUF88 family protein